MIHHSLPMPARQGGQLPRLALKGQAEKADHGGVKAGPITLILCFWVTGGPVLVHRTVMMWMPVAW